MKKLMILWILFILSLPLLLSADEYKRSYFRHWIDIDQDCQESRAETLIRYNMGILTFKTDKNCVVVKGAWICPYTGILYYFAKDLDIDHIIPLKWAWNHGASEWTDEKRKVFANDPENLLAVQARSNRQKGAKGINQWLPSNTEFIRTYIAKWFYLQEKYGLK